MDEGRRLFSRSITALTREEKTQTPLAVGFLWICYHQISDTAIMAIRVCTLPLSIIHRTHCIECCTHPCLLLSPSGVFSPSRANMSSLDTCDQEEVT